jgi:N-acetylglucosaminyldiphosphoundecaprenol N-acetyl-beta-D-mannosaminyltransferase
MELLRQNILGVHISAINMEQAVDTITDWIIRDQKKYICVTPAHSIMECHNRPALKSIFNSSGLTTPDGMIIVWLLKAMGHRHVNRVYGPDLLLEVCKYSVHLGWSHYFYGGGPGVADKLSQKLYEQFPGLQISGCYSPPFYPLTKSEDEKIIHKLNESNADIIWIGLGSPKQEEWIAKHRSLLSSPVLVGVGAAFDFLSGVKPQAPRWVQRNGLEWLYRLSKEPRRLWRRYIEYPKFLGLVIAQSLGLIKF